MPVSLGDSFSDCCFPNSCEAPLSLFLISLSLVRLVFTRGSWWVRQTWPCSHSGVLKLERGYTWLGGRLCWNLQVSCPWDKETQGEADISMVTGFTQQTSWLVFCEASKTGRKANASPPESRCLSLTILLTVISTFWNEDDGLGLPSSFSNAKSNLCRAKQQCLLLPGLLKLCRTMQVTEAGGISFSSHHSPEACGLVTWNQRLIRTEENLKGQLIQPPTQDMPSRTNHPHCRLLIYVAIQGSYGFSGEMTHPQGVTKLRIVSWAVMGKGLYSHPQPL